jgi:hypothetical protein
MMESCLFTPKINLLFTTKQNSPTTKQAGCSLTTIYIKHFLSLFFNSTGVPFWDFPSFKNLERIKILRKPFFCKQPLNKGVVL